MNKSEVNPIILQLQTLLEDREYILKENEQLKKQVKELEEKNLVFQTERIKEIEKNNQAEEPKSKFHMISEWELKIIDLQLENLDINFRVLNECANYIDKKMANKLKLFYRLQRFSDLNKIDTEMYWGIFFNNAGLEFLWTNSTSVLSILDIRFNSKEIAQEAARLFEKEINEVLEVK